MLWICCPAINHRIESAKADSVLNNLTVTESAGFIVLWLPEQLPALYCAALRKLSFSRPLMKTHAACVLLLLTLAAIFLRVAAKDDAGAVKPESSLLLVELLFC